MIQGDEPMVVPEMIDESIRPILTEPSTYVVNLMAPLKSKEEQEDPHEIKVVTDRDGFALYFSRLPIPYNRGQAKEFPMYKQVCVISFRREFLLKYNQWESCPLEKAESVDMLRILEYRHKIRMVKTKFLTYSVDTPEDLIKVDRLMRNDHLMRDYNPTVRCDPLY